MSDPKPEELAEKVRAALFAGRKIEAIKLYREQTGLGLKESKEAMEKLEAELRESSPGEFSVAPGKGCTQVILMVVVAVIVLAALLN